MRTRDHLLALFESSKGVYLSGEEIAGRLSISRAAVWKAVNALRADGYRIDAVQNKGYCLSPETDILSVQGIQKYLNAYCDGLSFELLPEAGSTNTILRDKASAGAPEGTVVMANRQTSGRGRLGRKFYSPAESGIYLSLLLRPRDLTADRAILLPAMAAVAVCETVSELSGRPAGIKWVNDVFLDGKKVCGILTEASLGMESNLMDYVVLGVGINAYAPPDGFPEDLAAIAGAVFQEKKEDGKNALAATFLNRFMEIYRTDRDGNYVKKYRELNLALGKEILVLSGGTEKKALALDVDDQCRLLVRYEDGTEAALSYGEISTRML